MKKKITAIFLCVALVAIAVVGASLAYFTDTKTATNTFTMGDVKIKLDETNVNDTEGDRVTSNEYNVYPGAVVTKDPIVHNTGKNAAYIRAIVTVENGMNWLGLYNDNVWTAPQEAAFNALINNTLGEDWELVDITYDMSGPDHPTSDFVATLKYTKVLDISFTIKTRLRGLITVLPKRISILSTVSPIRKARITAMTTMKPSSTTPETPII